MSAKERCRLEAFGRVKRGELSVVDAAALCGLSVRQARRMWRRFAASGAAGLVHRSRGRPSNRRIGQATRDRIVKLHQERFGDFGPTFACEQLAVEAAATGEAGLAVSPDTLVNLLKARGLWVRRRRRGRHRRRRERKACFGEMVQGDGSVHDWLEGRGPRCVLMNLVDDATNTTLARLYPAETTEAAFDAFERWARRYGVPRRFYVDRHGIYRDEDHPARPTQFGRAMTELGVELICARSPQAKGRVERRHGLFQDRLVKELRLRGIDTIDGANAYLEATFLKQVNTRYAVAAARKTDLHRPAPPDLAQVLCVRERRVVGHDWCVRWRNRWLQIAREHEPLNLPGKTVTVKQLRDRDRRLVVLHGERTLTVRELDTRPTAARAKRPIVNNKRYKPASSHPWAKREPLQTRG
jgi:transposase